MTDATAPDARAAVEAAVRLLRTLLKPNSTTVWMPLTTGDALRTVLADHDALAARVAELEAVVAEGNERSRALALLLIRNGGQVEFTQVEQVTAPQHGDLISYPNPATGGLVLAYSADGETVGIPQQSAPAPAEQAAGDGEAERKAVEAAERFADAWRENDEWRRTHGANGDTWFQVAGTDADLTEPQLRAVLDRLRRLERERAEPVAYLKPPEAADLLGVTTRTLLRWRQDGDGPAFAQAGRVVRYRSDVIEDWSKTAQHAQAKAARQRALKGWAARDVAGDSGADGAEAGGAGR